MERSWDKMLFKSMLTENPVYPNRPTRLSQVTMYMPTAVSMRPSTRPQVMVFGSNRNPIGYIGEWLD